MGLALWHLIVASGAGFSDASMILQGTIPEASGKVCRMAGQVEKAAKSRVFRRVLIS